MRHTRGRKGPDHLVETGDPVGRHHMADAQLRMKPPGEPYGEKCARGKILQDLLQPLLDAAAR
jgi:hypothetical protein